MENNNIRWTWADLVSSYRFWGLIIFTICISPTVMLLSFVLPNLKEDLYLSAKESGLIFIIRALGILFGIVPAWIASRAKSYYSLYVFALFIILALLMAYFTTNFFVLLVCSFLMGLFFSASGLLIAANIAKAVNSIECFVLVFGLISISSATVMIIPPLLVYIISTFGYKDTFLVCTGIIVIAVLFLLPTNKSLFNEAPRIRQVEGGIKLSHDPILTFLLFAIIPFYFIYWCIRTHQYIRNYSQSASLLTPFAAGWCSLLVPFAIPVMLINLNDAIDDACLLDKCSRWKLILLTIFLLPIAVAIVQDRLNQLMSITDNRQLSHD
ncbi:MFS transporter [Orbus mooreae]|uniref:MFS transporter n=1 Tax=Orbus mooreae TaxID=3074107 RepID=UPI00370D3869